MDGRQRGEVCFFCGLIKIIAINFDVGLPGVVRDAGVLSEVPLGVLAQVPVTGGYSIILGGGANISRSILYVCLFLLSYRDTFVTANCIVE